jgi:hypothetical protein
VPDIPRSPGRQALPGVGGAPRVRPAHDFTASLPAMSRAAQEARGLAQDGQELLLREIERMDRLAVGEADAKLSQSETAMMWDKEKGLLTRQKKSALGLEGVAREEHEKSVQEIMGGLHSRAQRDAFLARARARQEDVARAARRHEAVEIRRWDDEVKETRISAGRNDAVVAGVDELVQKGTLDGILKGLARQQGAVLDHGERNQVDPELAALEVARIASATHRGVIGRLLDSGQDLLAKDYFARYRGQLMDGDLQPAERALKIGNTAGEARRLVDGFMKEATSFKDLMEKARAIEDLDTRKEAEQYAKVRWDERKHELHEARETAYNDARGRIDADDGKGATLTEVIGPTAVAAMDPKDIPDLEKALRIKRGLEAPVTDQALYYSLKTMGANEDTRREFLGKNLLHYQHKLTQQDFQELTNFQVGLIQKDGKAIREAKGFLSKEDLINARADTITDKTKRVEFKKFMDREIQLWQENQTDPTKMPSKDDIEKMMKDVVRENAGFWGGKTTSFTPPTDEEAMAVIARKDKAIEEIERQHPGAKEKMIKILLEAGRPITADALLELYSKWKGAPGGR